MIMAWVALAMTLKQTPLDNGPNIKVVVHLITYK